MPDLAAKAWTAAEYWAYVDKHGHPPSWRGVRLRSSRPQPKSSPAATRTTEAQRYAIRCG